MERTHPAGSWLLLFEGAWFGDHGAERFALSRSNEIPSFSVDDNAEPRSFAMHACDRTQS